MVMEESMRGCMRKLALWHTNTFTPILTHDHLDPIMSTLGFVGLPPTTTSSWKEYAYCGGGSRRADSWGGESSTLLRPPRPRLPYPRIDGLHCYTYQAFIDAVNFHLRMCDVTLLFHVRGMPLQPQDLRKRWRRMLEDNGVFVYREGTLDQATYSRYHSDKHNHSNNSSREIMSRSEASFDGLRKDAATAAGGYVVVSLKDIVV